MLAINDSQGALTVPTGARWAWTDSALSHRAITRNAALNQLPPPEFLTGAEPISQTDHALRYVILRVPKQLNYFEYQLNQLALHLPAGSTVFCSGMDKHLSPNTASLLEKHIGSTTRHRGRRKARLFTSVLEKPGDTLATGMTSYFCEPLNVELYSLPNVFSQHRLDQGTRLLLETLITREPAHSVIDLGCGNGVLGIFAGLYGGAQSITFCDESAMAVKAAEHNARRLFSADETSNAMRSTRHSEPRSRSQSTTQPKPRYNMHWGDGLRDYTGPKVKRILVNPPFHAGHLIDPGAGKKLLALCARHLLPEGELLVVANRHLNYQPTLKKRFATVELVAQNKKFVVLCGSRPQDNSE